MTQAYLVVHENLQMSLTSIPADIPTDWVVRELGEGVFVNVQEWEEVVDDWKAIGV